MADTKLADLTALTTPSGDDLLYVVDDPAGTPSDKKLALDNLFTRGTVTVSSPVIDAAQTWNNAGVTFTGLKFNATDTASAAASLLMDLQVGGVSAFRVSKAGTLRSAIGTIYPWGFVTLTNQGFSTFVNDSQTVHFGIGGTVNLVSGGTLSWSTNASFPGNPGDLFLRRRAAANLQFGAADAAAPVAQTLSVQSVVTGTTNTAGANLTITGSQGTGTGAGGSIIFQVAPAGLAGTNVNGLETALTIGSNKNATFNGTIVGSLTNAGSIDLNAIRYQVHIKSGVNDNVVIGAFKQVDAGHTAGLTLLSYGGLVWSTGAATLTTVGVALLQDAANTLAQRNGNNGQIFRLYGRFTDITNDFERFFINAPTTAGAAVLLGTQKGATAGTARALEFQTDGTTRLTIAATTGNVTTTGSVTTEAPTGGTAAAWRLGTVASVTPTLQNRTIEVDIGGTIYYISAKTTND